MSAFSYKIYTPHDKLTTIERTGVANFLFEHLGKYGDPLADIKLCIDYSMKEVSAQGGYVITCRDNGNIIGVVIINKTGMSGYIPENILVYIAVDKNYRGQGIGQSLMKKAIDYAEGAIALHVEPDNPAKKLYERLGFENKYLEMRYNGNKN